MSKRLVFLVAALAGGACRADDLAAYVTAPDPSYAWRIERRSEVPGGKAVVVELTSQTWRGNVWKHWVTIVEPATVDYPDAALLVVNGGQNGRPAPALDGPGAAYLAAIAGRMRCLVVVLSQIPNQPLLEARGEDALIAHTFDRYLVSGEKDWPLLFPMTKSAVRAMDLVQGLAPEELGRKIERFCVTGGSKRGWTTWLVAACDRRVAAIAPMVIDTLNLSEQTRHQIRSWGAFSPEVHDYTELELQRRMDEDPRGPGLVESVDPYARRGSIGMPKLILLGTNDPYWPVDSARFYFDDLVGESYLHYVPNAGHGLDPTAAEAVAGFFRTVLAGRPRPRVAWRTTQGAEAATLVVVCSDEPVACRLWSASSHSRDFREAKWSDRAVAPDERGAYVVRVSRPDASGDHEAFFAEFDYPADGGGTYSVCTRVEVLPGGVQ